MHLDLKGYTADILVRNDLTLGHICEERHTNPFEDKSLVKHGPTQGHLGSQWQLQTVFFASFFPFLYHWWETWSLVLCSETLTSESPFPHPSTQQALFSLCYQRYRSILMWDKSHFLGKNLGKDCLWSLHDNNHSWKNTILYLFIFTE